MQEDGIKDEKQDFLKFACKRSYPEQFNEAKRKFGLDDLSYDWLEKYYDEGHVMVEAFRQAGVKTHLSHFTKVTGELMTDYSYDPDTEPDNFAPNGRGLGIGSDPGTRQNFQTIHSYIVGAESWIRSAAAYVPGMKDLLLVNTFGIDLSYGVGIQMVGSFENVLTGKGVDIKKGCGVQSVLLDEDAVVGVKLVNGDSIKATKGVIFATGGFSQDQDMVKEHIPHPVYMTGACATSSGDFHKTAIALGAEMKAMSKIWGCQTWLEQAFEKWEDQVCLFQVRGDSMLMVGREGSRVMNEKMAYDKRVRVHWQKDAAENYPNQFVYLIGDERCVDAHGANFAKTWPADMTDKYYIKSGKGDGSSSNVGALVKKLKERLAKLKTDGKITNEMAANLVADFEAKVGATIDKFNGYAETGVDLDFHRGKAASEREWTVSPTNDKPNVTMYPIDTSSELYCLILAPSIVDTKGGPATSTNGEVLRPDGGVIKGLYAAGNSSAPISGDAYWSGGATLGTAMLGGWVAGGSAARAPARD
jgi:succinate dehydrogenase/fumarate reductase flavoprotein subunit